jgi:transcriptional regulator with XRE-family HTH domain
LGRDSAFGRRLAELRAEHGLSLRQLGLRAHFSRSFLWELESGIKSPSAASAARLDEALSAGGQLVALAQAERAHRDDADGSVGCLDDPDEIDQRRRRVNASNVDDARLRYVEEEVLRLIAEYERRPPPAMAPQVRNLRRHVDEMLAGRQHPPQRDRLYATAVHLSGLLGALALDLGLPDHARAYGLETFDLAEAAGNPDLQAWARAAQSLIAYYEGDYHGAVAFARDGQRRAPCSPHRVRLAVNGEARALSRLGDAYGVDAAVDRGFSILGDNHGGPVSASMTLGVYCAARTGANAATAYLALAQPAEVERYATAALTAFDREAVGGPQALTRLDLATAALMSPKPDPDRASGLAVEAMTVSAPQRFESVHQRAREFTFAARPWASQPKMREVAALVAERGRPIVGELDLP